MEALLSVPRVPPKEYGRIASLPNSAEIARKREAISSRASSQEIRFQHCVEGVEEAGVERVLPLASAAAGPLRPILRMGYNTRSGEYTLSRYFATFAHKNPR